MFNKSLCFLFLFNTDCVFLFSMSASNVIKIPTRKYVYDHTIKRSNDPRRITWELPLVDVVVLAAVLALMIITVIVVMRFLVIPSH